MLDYMAIELQRFLTDQLARLPADHPDRRFLAGLASTVTAYTERPETAAAVVTAPPATPVAGEQPVPAERQERVRLAGRVGAQPQYHTTGKGRFLVRFPLAEHVPEQEEPVWHTIFVFAERARRLQEKGLARGDAVEVVGYRHRRLLTRRDGVTKEVEDIYAVAVRSH